MFYRVTDLTAVFHLFDVFPFVKNFPSYYSVEFSILFIYFISKNPYDILGCYVGTQEVHFVFIKLISGLSNSKSILISRALIIEH